MRQFLTLLFATLASVSTAAEFRGITAEMVADSFSYDYHLPVLQIETISGDGSTIGGSIIETGIVYDCATLDCATSAFVWTYEDSSRRNLGTIALNEQRHAHPKWVPALSYDGLTSLVLYAYDHIETGLHASGTVTPLREPLLRGPGLAGAAMSSDGQTVVGVMGTSPFVWKAEEGIEILDGFPQDIPFGGRAISNDKSTIIIGGQPSLLGFISTGFGTEVFQQTSDGERTLLSPIAQERSSNANAISSDGSVIVGDSTVSDTLRFSRRQATIWTTGQPAALEAPARNSIALDVSASGEIVVGAISQNNVLPVINATPVSEAAMWEDGEFRSIKELLVEVHGLTDELQGWTLTSAKAISDDGMTIVGEGIDPEGNRSAWVAILTVPVPSSMAVIGCAIVACIAVRPNALRWCQH